MDPELNVQNNTPEAEGNRHIFQPDLQELRARQSLIKGFLAGLIAGVIGALLWAMVTVATGYQIGWMAVGVGFLVGYAVRFAGKGIDPAFGIMGAMLALAGCILGNVFSIYMFISKEYALPLTSVFLHVNMTGIYNLMQKSFDPRDLIFYAIALIEGFRFSTIPTERET